VGFYLGGGSFIHASSGQGRVVISTLTGYYATAFSWGEASCKEKR
jgi:cell wall-associated NlpC family hydrolase